MPCVDLASQKFPIGGLDLLLHPVPSKLQWLEKVRHGFWGDVDQLIGSQMKDPEPLPGKNRCCATIEEGRRQAVKATDRARKPQLPRHLGCWDVFAYLNEKPGLQVCDAQRQEAKSP